MQTNYNAHKVFDADNSRVENKLEPATMITRFIYMMNSICRVYQNFIWIFYANIISIFPLSWKTNIYPPTVAINAPIPVYRIDAMSLDDPVRAWKTTWINSVRKAKVLNKKYPDNIALKNYLWRVVYMYNRIVT